MLGQPVCERRVEPHPRRVRVPRVRFDPDPLPPEPFRHRTGRVAPRERVEDGVPLVRQKLHEELDERLRHDGRVPGDALRAASPVVAVGTHRVRDRQHRVEAVAVRRGEHVRRDRAAVVREERGRADVVFGRPLAAGVGALLEQLLHAVAVFRQHLAVVRLRVRRRGHPPDAGEGVLHAGPADRHPLGRRRQPGGVEADELLAEVQPGRLLEREQRLDRGGGDGRRARHPAVAEFEDDRPVRREHVRQRLREPREPRGEGIGFLVAVLLLPGQREGRRREHELHRAPPRGEGVGRQRVLGLAEEQVPVRGLVCEADRWCHVRLTSV